MKYFFNILFIVITTLTLAQNNSKNISQEASKDSLKNSEFQLRYSGIIEAAYDFGALSFGAIGFGMDREKLDIINGCRITPLISLGVGTGLHYFFDFDEKKIFVPVFLDIRANFTKQKLSPYCSLSGGYSFNSKKNFEKVGFLINSTLGLRYKILDKLALNVGFGFEMQKIENFLWGEAYLNAINFNIGISY